MTNHAGDPNYHSKKLVKGTNTGGQTTREQLAVREDHAHIKALPPGWDGGRKSYPRSGHQQAEAARDWAVEEGLLVVGQRGWYYRTSMP